MRCVSLNIISVLMLHTRPAIMFLFSPQRRRIIQAVFFLYYFYRDIVFWYVRADSQSEASSHVRLAVFPDSSHTNPISRWKEMISFQQVLFLFPFLSSLDSSVFHPWLARCWIHQLIHWGVPVGKDGPHYLDWDKDDLLFPSWYRCIINE